jgi:hypothetical protein
LVRATLTKADLTGANLANASLDSAMLANANLTGTNLSNAVLVDTTGMHSATFDATTRYSQWTVFPTGFDPLFKGLTYVPSLAGDFDADDVLEAADIDSLTDRIRGDRRSNPWLPDTAFDLDQDGEVNFEDHRMWVTEHKHTWIGDANLDGEFKSSDMVQVFAAGKYKREAIVHRRGIILNPVSWSEGDWDGDGIFDSSDMVAAFADGGYEQGAQPVAVVPEPGSVAMLLAGLIGFGWVSRSRRKSL